MKKLSSKILIVSITIISFITLSCSEESIPCVNLRTDISGRWLVTRTINDTIHTEYPAGYVDQVEWTLTVQSEEEAVLKTPQYGALLGHWDTSEYFQEGHWIWDIDMTAHDYHFIIHVELTGICPLVGKYEILTNKAGWVLEDSFDIMGERM